MVLAHAGTHGNTGGPMDWFNQLPKVTRGYAALCVFTAACVSWGLPAVAYVFLDWSAVWHQWQVWRLVTHSAVIGKFGFPLIFNVIWILTYGSTLERSVYSIHPEDYLFMLIFGTAAMAVLSLIAGPLLHLAWLPISGKAIVMMMVYVWSKNFPEQGLKLYGIVAIKGFWLPFAFLAIATLMGDSPYLEVCGILAGHAWYFFTDLLPRGTGRTFLPTPQWVRALAVKIGMEGVTAQPVAAAAAAQPLMGRTRFRGTGQRLGGS